LTGSTCGQRGAVGVCRPLGVIVSRLSIVPRIRVNPADIELTAQQLLRLGRIPSLRRSVGGCQRRRRAGTALDRRSRACLY
jgi:hypothetical protein